MTTLAPSSASLRAMAAPMPRLAPVTSARFPFSKLIGIPFAVTDGSRRPRRFDADPGDFPWNTFSEAAGPLRSQANLAVHGGIDGGDDALAVVGKRACQRQVVRGVVGAEHAVRRSRVGDDGAQLREHLREVGQREALA